MAQPRRPRRIVRYKIVNDALGPYIVLQLDDVLLPRGIPAHRLPADTSLQWVRVEWRFLPGDTTTGPHDLRRYFLDFAEQMGWDVRLQT